MGSSSNPKEALGVGVPGVDAKVSASNGPVKPVAPHNRGMLRKHTKHITVIFVMAHFLPISTKLINEVIKKILLR